MKRYSYSRIFIAYLLTTQILLASPSPHALTGQGAAEARGFLDQLSKPELKKAQAQCMGGVKYSNGEKGRRVGKMSDGYFYGMMMSFAKNVCAMEGGKGKSDYQRTLSLDGYVTNRDTFSNYEKKDAKSAAVLKNAGSALAKNFALLLPLGMLESSGMFNEGRDKSASNVDPKTTEAGLFQVSGNSVNKKQVPKAVYAELMAKYENGNSKSKCMVDVYKANQRMSGNSESTGAPPDRHYNFQEAMKKCPALATDYMAYLLRKDFKHNGPIRDVIAKPRAECITVLNEVEKYAKGNCGSLDGVSTALGANTKALPPMEKVADYDGGTYKGRKQDARFAQQLADQARSAREAAAEAEKTGDREEQKRLLEEAQEAEKAAEAFKKDKALIQYQKEQLEKSIQKSKPLLDKVTKDQAKLDAAVSAAQLELQNAKTPEETAAAKKKLDEATEAAKLNVERKKKLEEQIKTDTEATAQLVKHGEKLDVQGQIEKINQQIAALTAADPNSPKLKELNAKVGELKKKLGELEKAVPPTPQPPVPPTEAPPAGATTGGDAPPEGTEGAPADPPSGGAAAPVAEEKDKADEDASGNDENPDEGEDEGEADDADSEL